MGIPAVGLLRHVCEEPRQRLGELIGVDQERVVAVGRVDLDVLRPSALRGQAGVELLLLVGRIEHVAPDAHGQRRHLHPSHRTFERRPTPRDVVQIHRLADRQIAVGVEPSYELHPVVVEVALDLEALPHPEHLVLWRLVGHLPSEPVGEDVVGAERDLGDHPRDRQPFGRAVARFGVVVVTVAPAGRRGSHVGRSLPRRSAALSLACTSRWRPVTAPAMGT